MLKTRAKQVTAILAILGVLSFVFAGLYESKYEGKLAELYQRLKPKIEERVDEIAFREILNSPFLICESHSDNDFHVVKDFEIVSSKVIDKESNTWYWPQDCYYQPLIERNDFICFFKNSKVERDIKKIKAKRIRLRFDEIEKKLFLIVPFATDALIDARYLYQKCFKDEKNFQKPSALNLFSYREFYLSLKKDLAKTEEILTECFSEVDEKIFFVKKDPSSNLEKIVYPLYCSEDSD